jgi:ubiquinone/menaquinone biosynthesis C-methylase UbiE
MSELTERQERERQLHDRWASGVVPDELLVEESFQAPTAQENCFILGFLGPLAGKRILDLGAGAGEASLYFASRGARVTALDISPAQLEVLSRAASTRGLAVEALAIPAEELPFPDQTFDIAYGNSVLHHVDCQRVIPEVRRVLKPGGRAAFIEPLAYNPLVRVYRRMGADIHTPDERPLRMLDIRWIMSQFRNSEHR